MYPTNPLSPLCSIIIFLLPGIWYFSFAITQRNFDNKQLQLFLTPATAICLLLFFLQIFGQLSGSFTIGLFSSSTILCLLGIGVFIKDGKQINQSISSYSQSTEPNTIMWASAMISSLVIAILAFNYHFHDEIIADGHMTRIAQIQNDAYPPAHTSFPSSPILYHYAFNSLCTMLTAIFRFQIPVSIDIATILLWFYTWVLLYLLGERILPKQYALILPAIVLFGGGLHFLGTSLIGDHPFVDKMQSRVFSGTNPINQLMLSYFFQHPWSMGLPIGISALLLHLEKKQTQQSFYYGHMALFFIALSLSHIVIFLTFFGSILVSELFNTERKNLKLLGQLSALTSVVFVGAFMMGGWFQINGPGTVESGLGLGLRDYGGFFSLIKWNLINFGLLLPLGLIAAIISNRLRVFLIVLTLGSLFVFNFIEYQHTNDMLKFSVITHISLAFFTSILIGHLISQKKYQKFKAGLIILLPLTFIQSLFFMTVLITKMEGSSILLEENNLIELSPHDIKVIDWLRDNVKPNELVFRDPPFSIRYSHIGGLRSLIIFADYNFNAINKQVPPEEIQKRMVLLKNPPNDPDYYLALNTRYFVLAPSNNFFNAYVLEWAEKGRAKPVKNFGPLVIYEVIEK